MSRTATVTYEAGDRPGVQRIDRVELMEVSLVTIPEGMPPDVAAGWGIHALPHVWESWKARPWMERAFLRIKYLNYGKELGR